MLPSPSILLAVDIVVIAVTWWSLQVLLVQRDDIGKADRVLPWWFVWQKETLLEAAKRKLKEETWYGNFSIHNVGVFDAIERDKRWRVVSAGFLALTYKTDFPFKDGKSTHDAKFFSLEKLPKLWFDHKEIIKTTLKYIQNTIMHTDIAKPLFDKQFTLNDLQTVYELILWKKLNVRNFRKKIIDIELIKPTWNIEMWVGHRPAQYYMFA